MILSSQHQRCAIVASASASISVVSYLFSSGWTHGAHHLGIKCVLSISLVSAVVSSVWIQVAHHWGTSMSSAFSLVSSVLRQGGVRVPIIWVSVWSSASAWYLPSLHQCAFRVPIIGVSVCSQHQLDIICACVSVDSGCPSFGYPCVFSSSLVSSVVVSWWIQGAHHWGISVSSASDGCHWVISVSSASAWYNA